MSKERVREGGRKGKRCSGKGIRKKGEGGGKGIKKEEALLPARVFCCCTHNTTQHNSWIFFFFFFEPLGFSFTYGSENLLGRLFPLPPPRPSPPWPGIIPYKGGAEEAAAEEEEEGELGLVGDEGGGWEGGVLGWLSLARKVGDEEEEEEEGTSFALYLQQEEEEEA